MRRRRRRPAAEPGRGQACLARPRAYRPGREEAARASGVEPLPPGAPTAGGMPDRVKCLHALVAHELAAPGANPLGREAVAAMAEWWAAGPCVELPGGAVAEGLWLHLARSGWLRSTAGRIRCGC